MDESHMHTENHADANMENLVHHGKGHLDTEMDMNERTSSLSLQSPEEANPSLPTVTGTGETDLGSKDIPDETSKTVDPADAVLLWDSALHRQSKDSYQQGHPVTTERQQTEAETADGGSNSQEEDVDGETEKQDVEEDEKNENKLENQRAGRRTKVEVSGVPDYCSDISGLLDCVYRRENDVSRCNEN